jgi:hypothetical protein
LLPNIGETERVIQKCDFLTKLFEDGMLLQQTGS